MKHLLWQRLSAELTVSVDKLLRCNEKLSAVMAIRASLNDPRPEIDECLNLLHERSAELQESAPKWHSSPHPAAVAAAWDDDTNSWVISLAGTAPKPQTEPQSNGEGSLRSKAHAAIVGRALADRLGVPFHFVDSYQQAS